ncbi:hypothetical protein Tco_1136537 [Tanacetum coccineum]
MSASEDSTVTYTAVSSSFEGLSNIGSPRVDGPPMMPEDPYAYVVAVFQAPPSPDYVLARRSQSRHHLYQSLFLSRYTWSLCHRRMIYSQLRSEQPLPATVSPTADSSGYILESDPEEDDDEDPEEDPADYPTDRDDDEEIFIPAQAPVPFLSEEKVERFLAIPTPPSSPLTPLSSLLPQIPSPTLPVSPPLPISPPPLPASPTYPLGFKTAMIRQRAESPSTSHSLLLPPPIILSHTRASVAMMRVAAPPTYILASRSETPPSGTPPLLPIPLPTPSPPLLLPFTDRRADRPEVCLPPRKRLYIAQGPRYDVGESSSAPRPTRGFRAYYGFVATLDVEIRRDPERAIGYGITDTWDDMLVGMPGAPATDDTKLGRRMTEFATMFRQDTNEICGRLDEAQDARAVLSGRLNLLQRYRHSHAYTALLMEREARLSREAWGRSMAASDATRSEVMALRTTVLGQQAEIAALLLPCSQAEHM